MNKGFTLIELLGVVAVLGILMGIAIPSMVSSNKNAEEQKKVSFEHTINDACTTYLSVNSENTTIKALFESSTVQNQILSTESLIEDGYLKSGLTNPYNDNKTLRHGQNNIIAIGVGGNICCCFSSDNGNTCASGKNKNTCSDKN